MTLLIDIAALSDRSTDHALELIHKAIGDGEDTLWDKHPSPFIRRIVELFTQRGLLRLDGLRQELEQWMERARHSPAAIPPRPDGSMLRWSEDEIALVRIYLTRLSPEQFELDDHMLLVDYLVQKYLPENQLRSESEWLTTRSALMGRVQANIAALSAKQADTVLDALPGMTEAAARFRFSPRQIAVMNFASSRAADRVRKVSDDTRYRLRNTIRLHTEQRVLGTPGLPGSLQTKLIDDFGVLNRDWRRIAVTEAGEAANQGMVSSMRDGDRLKRVERYRGACPFCRGIDGKIVEVVPPDQQVKDGATQIWAGKDNVGRSASPKRRVGRLLIDRGPGEMWWIPAGTVHPNCRGRWVTTASTREGDDADFASWLKSTLER